MKIVALDHGTVRTGVAVSDETGTLARPLTVIERVGTTSGFASLLALLEAERPARIVVGLPLSLDGREHGQARSARAFATAPRRRRRGPRRTGRRAVHDQARRPARRGRGARRARRGDTARGLPQDGGWPGNLTGLKAGTGLPHGAAAARRRLDALRARRHATGRSARHRAASRHAPRRRPAQAPRPRPARRLPPHRHLRARHRRRRRLRARLLPGWRGRRHRHRRGQGGVEPAGHRLASSRRRASSSTAGPSRSTSTPTAYATRFMPGTYQFHVNEPYDVLIAKLLKGTRPPTVKVSIPEGTTLKQAARHRVRRRQEDLRRRLHQGGAGRPAAVRSRGLQEGHDSGRHAVPGHL